MPAELAVGFAAMPRNALAALAFFFASTSLAEKPEPPVDQPEASLDTLDANGSFEVKLQGEKLDTFLSKKKCVYFEWSYGVREGTQWQTRWTGYHSEAPVVVLTPKGKLTLRMNQLRTYLGPSFEKTWTQKDSSGAPEVVKEKLAEEKAITAAEYCLEEGRTYYARLHVDTYRKPPLPGGKKPSEGRNTVLWLSDEPFAEDGKPKALLTPTYQGWSY
jgi:hypothetical protein